MAEIRDVNRQTAEVKKAKRFDDRDWKWIAEYIVSEWNRRKQLRRDKEREWDEIDRQVAMRPSIDFKMLPNGEPDSAKKWMAETELPLQAQALEVLQADSRRMLFADPWFRANALVDDDWLEKAKEIKPYGAKDSPLFDVNQENANEIVRSYLLHLFGQYDHTSRFDVINAESFKYGIGIGRVRLERKNIWIHEARGIEKETKRIPVIVPCSIKKLYLEEPKPSFHSATVLGRAHIYEDRLKYESIAIAANKGSGDPDDDDGGWMPKNLSRVVPDKRGYVTVLEMEGDIVVPRKTVKSVVIPGAIITVALGGPEAGGSSTRAVIRFRFRKYPFSSYLLFPYMPESADDAYPSGPLMKGRTVAMTATDATNRFLDAAMLKNHPPVGYDRNDPAFAQSGGPPLYPTAVIGTNEPLQVYSQVGGDPSALAQAVMQFINLYAELTGVLPARIGAATKSHTTATAKDAELQRGSVRTVDYVNQTGEGPITSWLNMAYQMGRDCLGSREKVTFYIKPYGAYVELDKSMLPEKSQFEWFGSNGPQEKRQKAQDKMAALKMAIEVDQLRMQQGMRPRLNLDAAQDKMLLEGGWTDIEHIVNTGGSAGGPAPAPALPGAAQGSGGPAVAALQNLGSAGG